MGGAADGLMRLGDAAMKSKVLILAVWLLTSAFREGGSCSVPSEMSVSNYALVIAPSAPPGTTWSYDRQYNNCIAYDRQGGLRSMAVTVVLKTSSAANTTPVRVQVVCTLGALNFYFSHNVRDVNATAESRYCGDCPLFPQNTISAAIAACTPCHSECAAECFGTTDLDCASCKTYSDDGHCVDACGTNKSPANNGTCICSKNWSGPSCQICQLQCQNRGTQLPSCDSCSCMSGFTGSVCESDMDDCALLSQPCMNGGQCLDGLNSYTCSCAAGYTGTTCETDIDDCIGKSVICLNGGTCHDFVNAWQCDCLVGYGGIRCEGEADECSSNPCQHGGTCADYFANYTCSCMDDYHGINCETQYNDCDGVNCVNGYCVDSVRDYSCVCQSGYTGRHCGEEILECASSPCENGGHCVDGTNAYTCYCLANTTGQYCETELHPCESTPCQNNATCVEQAANFSCWCDKGFSGLLCETDLFACSPDKCLNGGTCVQGYRTYSCACPGGYTGEQCETELKECGSTPCLNGGHCLDGVDLYHCHCLPGYSGHTCETDVDECASNPCRNQAECVDMPNGYDCHCPSGFYGMHCEADVCTAGACQRGARCLFWDGIYQCACAPGTTGIYCETDIDECETSPCVNGAQCIDEVGGYTCQCKDSQLGGKNCEVNLTLGCVNCFNGGSCPSATSSSCSCQRPWQGPFCQECALDCGYGSPTLECESCTCPIATGGSRCSCKYGCEHGTLDSMCTACTECQDGFSGSHCDECNGFIELGQCVTNCTAGQIPNAAGICYACGLNNCALCTQSGGDVCIKCGDGYQVASELGVCVAFSKRNETEASETLGPGPIAGIAVAGAIIVICIVLWIVLAYWRKKVQTEMQKSEMQKIVMYDNETDTSLLSSGSELTNA